MAALLTIDAVTQRFGGLTALSGIDLQIDAGEIIGIIGPNGAGKSTLFNVMTGIYTPTEGDIRLDGERITGKKPFQITALGLARTFQNIRLFPRMTVLENVMMGAHCRTKSSIWQIMLGTKFKVEEDRASRARAEEILGIFGLERHKFAMPTSLPYGDQRRLEIARAIASQPRLLLLDEPAAGMNEQETQELLGMVRRLRDMGYTVLLIEHDMKFVMNLCERIYVLNYGTLIAEGPPEQISADPRVIEAYLGMEVD